MNKHSETGNEFTVEEIQWDDLRLKQFLEVPAEEKQPSFHTTMQLISGSDELEIEDANLWHRFYLTDEDFNRLKSLDLRGKLRVTGCGASGQAPFKARGLIVAQRQIKEAVDLPQPNDCEVIYYQVGDEWWKFPSDASVLRKRFRLTIDSENEHLTNIWAEAYYGSEAGGGGGAFNWERAI
jgi:hypothetical protein